MIPFPATLFAYSLVLIGAQFILFGGDLVEENFTTLQFTTDNDGLLDTILDVVTFPFNFFIGMIRLCALTSTGLPVILQFMLGTPACVGLAWSTTLLVARVMEGIGALTPFT